MLYLQITIVFVILLLQKQTVQRILSAAVAFGMCIWNVLMVKHDINTIPLLPLNIFNHTPSQDILNFIFKGQLI